MRRSLLVAVASLLLAPAAASAQTYPDPKEPGPVQAPPKGPHKTYTVCASKGCDFTHDPEGRRQGEGRRHGPRQERHLPRGGQDRRHQEALPEADRQPRKNPEKVLLKAKGNMQNGVAVNDADEVTVDGFMARGYKANGFFFTNLNGYTMDHLIARQTGVYGLYAFNTIGGTILNSEAYYVNDGAFYIGQTPPQSKPVRTIVENVDGWGSPLGFSATNMRYVTITKSRFYNNALGIAPNALDSEKYPPAEGNVIIDNDIFWNNFNFHRATRRSRCARPARPRWRPSAPGSCCSAAAATGSRTTASTATTWPASPRSRASWSRRPRRRASLENNVIQNNQFGLNGTDINGFDIGYDGNGTNNCFALAGVTSTFPADGSTFAGCGGANAFSKPVQDAMLGWIGENALKAWKKHAHPAKPGYTPLEVFQ